MSHVMTHVKVRDIMYAKFFQSNVFYFSVIKNNVNIG